MEHQYRTDYSNLDEKQLVEMILTPPHNEEVAAFLLFNKYDNLLHGVYHYVTSSKGWYDDCVTELFIYLRGNEDNKWHALATFEWRSSLGKWLWGVAKNNFIATLRKLIEKGQTDITILQMPDNGAEVYEDKELRILLIEAISQLKDEDERFVILKRLEGYNSKEIAALMKKKWETKHFVKYNHAGDIVIPSVGYVDVKTQKAKKHLRNYINTNI